MTHPTEFLQAGNPERKSECFQRVWWVVVVVVVEAAEAGGH